MNDSPKFTNDLIHAQSPYLLQHAHNPVDWQEWNEKAWQKARTENKLVLVSIGYASCHWCHVMEHESFENEDTAAIMNEFFVCIKVDREERPDIDQIYMDAVQLISGHGGWPLNMFCLPDGKPLHGGTYFPNKQWNQLLFQLQDLWTNKRQEALDFAEKLTEGVRNLDLMKTASHPMPDEATFFKVLEDWSKQFDRKNGGMARSPKFPLPVAYAFLLSAGNLLHHEDAHAMTRLSLERMARGGLYDSLQGGFSRYSVDAFWKVPHFEKMLYDNAQLISLYARASQVLKEPFFEKIARQSIAFMEEEWKSPEGLYYSSYDADSEGEEGTYYIWTVEELQPFPAIREYYAVSKEGNWEKGKNILHATLSPEAFAKLKGYSKEWIEQLEKEKGELLAIRLKREKPALDDKCILSWNALALGALADAALWFQDESLTERAMNHAAALDQYYNNGTHFNRIVKNGHSSIPALLEDLAFLIEARIKCYLLDYRENYLLQARELCEYVIDHFYDEQSGFFFYVAHENAGLIARKKDLADDVLPSSNATMALNLIKLYHYFGEVRYKEIFDRMLSGMAETFGKYAPWYALWGQCYLLQHKGVYQLCFTGPGAREEANLFAHTDYSNLLVAAAESSSRLPLLENRIGKEPLYYLCRNESCFPPAGTWEEVMENYN